MKRDEALEFALFRRMKEMVEFDEYSMDDLKQLARKLSWVRIPEVGAVFPHGRDYV